LEAWRLGGLEAWRLGARLGLVLSVIEIIKRVYQVEDKKVGPRVEDSQRVFVN